MAQKFATIGDKTVRLSDPYKPDPQKMTVFVPDSEQIAHIGAAWMEGINTMPMAPLLVGEPGTGKNRTVYELAGWAGKDLYIFQGHEDVTSEDLAFTIRFSDDDRTKFDYVASPIVSAMVTGQICFIDEIGKIRPRALSLLASVLDERRYIDSTLLGERVKAKKGFRFIAATNTTDIVSDSLPEFIVSRLRPRIHIGIPERSRIEKILQKHFTRLGGDFQELFETFYSKWEALREKRADVPALTPRDAIHLFNLASSYADHEAYGLSNSENDSETLNLSSDAPTSVYVTHIQKAFDDLYGHGYMWEKEDS